MLAVSLLPERDCATCTVHQKRNWGCEDDAEVPLDMEGEEVWRCPRRFFLDNTAYVSELLWLYGQWQKGFMPEEGGISSQPHKLVRSVKIIDLAHGAVEEARREDDRRRTARAASVGRGRR